MSTIKALITSLCKVLSRVTNVEVQAEHLKGGKFNDNETSVVILWSVLHNLCCSSSNDEKCKDLVLCVKMCFASCHYNNFMFYCLPHNMSSGSREVLLALGWLLADTNALEVRLLEYVKTTLFSDIFKTSKAKDVLDDTDILSQNLTNDEVCHHIIWLAGRIKQNLKGISNMASEKLRLTSKVRTVTMGAYNLPYLTLEEMVLLRNINKQPNKQTEVAIVKSVLEDYFYFTEEQILFWDWLESVLSEDINNERTARNLEDLEEFIVMLKTDVRKEILKEPSDDYNVFFDHLKSKFIDCARNNQNKISDSLQEIKNDIEQVRTMYKENVSEISGYLEKLQRDK